MSPEVRAELARRVASFPPLSPAQRDQLRVLLRVEPATGTTPAKAA